MAKTSYLPGVVSRPPAPRSGPGVLQPTEPLRGPVSPVRLAVPWYSQFERGHGYEPGDTACLDASRAMSARAPVRATVLGVEQRIQVARGQDGRGRVYADPARTTEGRSYIDSELDAGRPVVVGVSHQAGLGLNADRITGHFVVITGRLTDEQGQVCYTFNEPATSNRERGSDRHERNRFYVDAQTGVMYREGNPDSPLLPDRRYEVSMVRMNAESQLADPPLRNRPTRG